MTTSKSTRSWVLGEFKELCCGDSRIDRRFVTVACDAIENPAARINHASEDWAATKGAYRFFSNPKADKEKIMECHKTNTINRMKGKKTVLTIQDSSYLDFTNHTKLKGKGPIGTRQQKTSGYVMHSTLAITTEGLPLGMLTLDLWARPQFEDKAKKPTSSKEDKESYKWIKALKEINEINSDVDIINISDREADFYDYFAEAKELDQKIIVRARYDREIQEDDSSESKEEAENKNRMWDHMSKQPVCFHDRVEISRNHINLKGKNYKEYRKKRMAELEIRVGKVTLKPSKYSKKTESLVYNLIFAKEVNAPEGVTPLEWMLVTNLPIDSIEDVSKVIKYYRLRWSIEEYHKVLKTGCGIEKCLLEDTESMFRYITLFCIVAWRLFWITRMQRIDPNQPCTAALTDVEWKGLYCYLHKTKEPPDKVPTIREAIVWVARLGGFLARKGDGEPGIITVWRGWSRLHDIVVVYEIFA